MRTTVNPMVAALCLAIGSSWLGAGAAKAAGGPVGGHGAATKTRGTSSKSGNAGASGGLGRPSAGARDASLTGSPCDELVALGYDAVVEPDLLQKARSEGWAKSDPVCLATASLRELNQGSCEVAAHAAEQAHRLAPADPLGSLSYALTRACMLSKSASMRGGGVPIDCDGKAMQTIAFEIGEGTLLAPLQGVAPLVVRTLESDTLLRCRDTSGIFTATIAALQMAAPGVPSRGLSLLADAPKVPWHITGALLLRRFQGFVAGQDPGSGGAGAIRHQALALLDEWFKQDPEGVPKSVHAQISARAILRADATLESSPETFGMALNDLSDLDRWHLLKTLPPLEASTALPSWGVDAAFGVGVDEQFRLLLEHLEPLDERPEGALLNFKLRSIRALRSDAAPSDAVRSIGSAISTFARHGAPSLPLESYKDLLLRISRRALGLARECKVCAVRIPELERIVQDLSNGQRPWFTDYIMGGGQ